MASTFHPFISPTIILEHTESNSLFLRARTSPAIFLLANISNKVIGSFKTLLQEWSCSQLVAVTHIRKYEGKCKEL